MTGAVREVRGVLRFDDLEMVAQGRPQADGEQGDAIFSSLAVTNDKMTSTEINVFDAKLTAFE